PIASLPSFPTRRSSDLLARGGAFFACTDGITEATDEHGRFFGEAGLEAALRSCAGAAPEELIAGILRDVRSFAGSAAQSDDIAADRKSTRLNSSHVKNS